MTRKMIIGVMGSAGYGIEARKIGAEIARVGCILLTGGGAEIDDRVKNAAPDGAINNNYQAPPRLVGILDDKIPQRERLRPNPPSTQILVHTRLPHTIRNVINGVTPDALIVFGGNCGTLAEAAFGIGAGKTIHFFGKGCIETLQRGLPELYKQRETYLTQPLANWAHRLPTELDTEQHFALLSKTLAESTEWKGDASSLVDYCVEVLGSTETGHETGFPGLPGVENSKEEFEDQVKNISIDCEPEKC